MLKTKQIQWQLAIFLCKRNRKIALSLHQWIREGGHHDSLATVETVAKQLTISSVVGSSITTIAGFVALCFMSFTLGLDLGIVMAKGVFIGVLSCITILPSMLLTFDKAIQKTKHKPLLPDMPHVSEFIVKHTWLFAILFHHVDDPAGPLHPSCLRGSRVGAAPAP